MANNLVVSLVLRIYWIPLKIIEPYGVNTTSFLKNFVVLMYLFKLKVIFWSYIVKKEESHRC